MNYRHAFHAGNFADVVKHAVLVRILAYLRRKPAPSRVLDTHAGRPAVGMAVELFEFAGDRHESFADRFEVAYRMEIEAFDEDTVAPSNCSISRCNGS